VAKRPQLVRLRDILENIDAVAEMMQDIDFAAYQRDLKLRRAVERCVEIVSEASRSIPEEMKAKFPEQPWPEIAAISNLLRHHYERIDDFIMWKIAARSLPELRSVIVSMVQREES
jgi:uncharacterized protein with HEPN domain